MSKKLHICTEEEPYFESKHGPEAIHPKRDYQRDSTDVRGARKMAIFRCTICGTRFQDEPPAWAQIPIGATPIPRPEPPPAPMPKLKIGRVTVRYGSPEGGPGVPVETLVEPVVETPPPIEAVFAPVLDETDKSARTRRRKTGV